MGFVVLLKEVAEGTGEGFLVNQVFNPSGVKGGTCGLNGWIL